VGRALAIGMLGLVALTAVGCRQLLGLDDPPGVPGAPTDATSSATDATSSATDAPPDAVPDAPPCPDADHDGICDAVDDWPCGPRPPAPSPTVVYAPDPKVTLTVTSIQVGLGSQTQLAVVPAGAAVPYQFHFQLSDQSCMNNCIDQIELGLVPGARLGCTFDGQVNATTGINGSTLQTFVAPTAPGAYDLRVNFAQNFSCNYLGATNWFPNGTPPPATLTIATICVE